MLRKLTLIVAVAAAFAIPSDAMARGHGGGGHGGGGQAADMAADMAAADMLRMAADTLRTVLDTPMAVLEFMSVWACVAALAYTASLAWGADTTAASGTVPGDAGTAVAGGPTASAVAEVNPPLGTFGSAVKNRILRAASDCVAARSSPKADSHSVVRLMQR